MRNSRFAEKLVDAMKCATDEDLVSLARLMENDEDAKVVAIFLGGIRKGAIEYEADIKAQLS